MKVEDSRGFYEPGTALLTYARETYHPAFGSCFMKTYRYIGDNGSPHTECTLTQLRAREPYVGMWPGDRVEYWDKDGNLLAQYTC